MEISGTKEDNLNYFIELAKYFITLEVMFVTLIVTFRDVRALAGLMREWREEAQMI